MEVTQPNPQVKPKGFWGKIESFFDRFNSNKKGVQYQSQTSETPSTKEKAASNINNSASILPELNTRHSQHPIQAPVAPVIENAIGPNASQPAVSETPQIKPVEVSIEPTSAEKPVEKKPASVGGVIEKPKIKPLKKLPFALRFLTLSNKELLFFYGQLETLVDSGVTLIDALVILQDQTKNKSVKKLYDQMILHINAGMSLAETMYLFPRIFPSMQAALIEAGERSGNLKRVLAQIVEDMEGRQDFVRKIKGAMFYPVVLIVLALSMVTGMMIFVIPKVAELYEQSNATLPALTQVVIDISDFVSEQYVILLSSILGGFLLLFIFFKYLRIGKILWEKIMSIIPIFGTINKEKNLMVFSANLSMLLESGVLIAEAFEITAKTMGNLHYEKELNRIRHGVILGKEVSEMMGLVDIQNHKFEKNKLFPLAVAQMVHIGELTGNIAKMLSKIRENYHKSIDYRLKNISAMIEPIMIFFVALLVGSILLAVMLPFFYIGNTIS